MQIFQYTNSRLDITGYSKYTQKFPGNWATVCWPATDSAIDVLDDIDTSATPETDRIAKLFWISRRGFGVVDSENFATPVLALLVDAVGTVASFAPTDLDVVVVLQVLESE